jgi:hypothetical protein
VIIGIKKSVLETKCRCGAIQKTDVIGKVSKFIEEFGEYENIVVQCPACKTYELLNMNIPLDDMEDGVKTGDISVEEEVNRYYIRVLQRLIREDFKQSQ